jgi:hypothetical protein
MPSVAKNKEPPVLAEGFVELQRFLLEYPKSCIYLPSLVLPVVLILQIIDIVQSDHISGAQLNHGQVELRTGNQGYIAFFESLTGIVDQMFVLIEQDAELWTGQQAQQRDWAIAQQDGDAEVVQFALYVIYSIGINIGELRARAVICLVEQELRLQAPAGCKIDLGKSPDTVTEFILVAKRLAIHLEEVGARFDTDVKPLCLHMRRGKQKG